MPSKKLMFVAGEASGDLHGCNLAKELLQRDSSLELLGFGGPQMAEANVRILHDPTQRAVVGFWEVLKNFSYFKQLFNQGVEALDKEKPDAVILIDYPGFNLRFAKEVHKRGIKLIYYISPQIWAWHTGRIKQIQEQVDLMLVFFPFEEKLYQKHGVDATFVGHPLLDTIQEPSSKMETLQELGLEDGLPVIGLLPGSREAEIRRHLPPMLKACEQLQKELPGSVRFVLIKAPHLDWDFYKETLANTSVQPKIIERWDYNCVYACDLVLVASGTATLECALLKRPMVVIYKTSWPSYWISRLLIQIPCISLANIVAEKKVVPELIQSDANANRIAEEALSIWQDKQRRDAMSEALQAIKDNLGEPGAASRAAEAVLRTLS